MDGPADKAYKLMTEEQIAEDARISAAIVAQLHSKNNSATNSPNRTTRPPSAGTKRARPMTATTAKSLKDAAAGWGWNSASDNDHEVHPPPYSRPASAGSAFRASSNKRTAARKQSQLHETDSLGHGNDHEEQLSTHSSSEEEFEQHDHTSDAPSDDMMIRADAGAGDMAVPEQQQSNPNSADELQRVVARMNRQLSQLQRENAQLKQAAIGHEEVQRVETLANEHAAAISALELMTSDKRAADKALKSQAAKVGNESLMKSIRTRAY